MKRAAADIVVFIERKHLRFIGIAVIERAVDNLVAVPYKRRADDIRFILILIAADDIILVKPK